MVDIAREAVGEKTTAQGGFTREVDGRVVPVPGLYAIDTPHTMIEFVARQLMVSRVRGKFSQFGGTVTIAEEAEASHTEVIIEASSVNTGDDKRDAHLRSSDFFDVETHPQIRFTSTEVTLDGEDFKVVGDLTIHGTTRPVELALEFNGVGPDPWGGLRAGFSATTEISRADFGIEFNIPLDGGGVVVGDKIKISLEIEAVLAS